MNEQLTPGAKVTWLYWPPDTRYTMCKCVFGEVVSIGKRVAIKVSDKRGKQHIRHVDAGRLLIGERPDEVYADSFYPVKGDKPEYKQR